MHHKKARADLAALFRFSGLQGQLVHVSFASAQKGPILEAEVEYCDEVDSSGQIKGQVLAQEEFGSNSIQQSWALVVGIDAYLHPRLLPPLRYAVEDAQAIAQVLRDDFTFLPDNIFELHDEETTCSAIIAVLDEELADEWMVHHEGKRA